MYNYINRAMPFIEKGEADMSSFDDRYDENARADAREKELQRQLDMDDTANCAPSQSFNGYGSSNYNNYNSYNSYNGYNDYSAAPPQGNMYGAPMQAPGDDNSPFYSSPDARFNVQGYGVYNELYTDKNGNPIKPRSARRLIIGFAVVFFIIGAVLLTFMICVVHSLRAKYTRCTYDAPAVVIDNIKEYHSTDDGTEEVYYPVFRYEYNSKTYEEKSTMGSSPAEFNIGSRTTIHLNPNDPKEFYTRREDGVTFFSLLLISGAFFVLAVMMVIVARKSKKNETARANGA